MINLSDNIIFFEYDYYFNKISNYELFELKHRAIMPFELFQIENVVEMRVEH